MVDGKLLHRIVVWPTYEDAAAAEADAASEDCKRTNKLTVWQTYEQAAAHTTFEAGGGGGGGEEEDDMTTVTVSVSSAELLALFSSPKVLVAAPGAGKMIVLNDYVVDYEFGTTAYTGAGDNGVFRTEILFDGSSIASGDDSAALRRMFAQTESQVAFGPNDLFASNIHMNRTAAENKALVLAGEGDYADGDGVAAVTVRYTIIDLL